jgi:hypothetical protein
MDTPKLTILCSAVKHEGMIFCGKRHHDAIKVAVETTNVMPVKGEQGFLTSENNFVSRKEAAKIAIAAGQIKELRFSNTELFSEDLY